jgi:RNA polymerase sigma-70 factor, ECF subfamily
MILIVLPEFPEEDRLLTRARHGDTDALREIYVAYFPPIFQYIRLRVDEVQQAEDLAGDVFLKLLKAFKGSNSPRRSLRGWLFRVARNVMNDHYGKVKHFTTDTLEEWMPSGDDMNPEIQVMRELNREQSRQAVLQLEFDQQEVIILRFGHAMSIKETSAIMGKSPSAIKSLQFRAINNLRRNLQEVRINQTDG